MLDDQDVGANRAEGISQQPLPLTEHRRRVRHGPLSAAAGLYDPRRADQRRQFHGPDPGATGAGHGLPALDEVNLVPFSQSPGNLVRSDVVADAAEVLAVQQHPQPPVRRRDLSAHTNSISSRIWRFRGL